jgi:hypothetical protein
MRDQNGIEDNEPGDVKWNPDTILKRGEKYTVEKTEVHTAHTKISIKGYNGKFNSICFLKEEN